MSFFKKAASKTTFFDRHPNVAVFLLMAMIVGVFWIAKRIVLAALFIGGFFYGLMVPKKPEANVTVETTVAEAEERPRKRPRNHDVNRGHIVMPDIVDAE